MQRLARRSGSGSGPAGEAAAAARPPFAGQCLLQGLFGGDTEGVELSVACVIPVQLLSRSSGRGWYHELYWAQ
mgnify:CR=1 FL=1